MPEDGPQKPSSGTASGEGKTILRPTIIDTSMPRRPQPTVIDISERPMTDEGEKKGVRTPTVIGTPVPAEGVQTASQGGVGQQKRAPSIIGPGASVPQPTDAPAQPQARPQPTAIPTTISTAHTSAQPASPAAIRPTPIAGGVERKRIPVTLADLAKANPGRKDAVLEQALQHVLVVSLEHTPDTEFALWGQESQEKFGKLSMRALELGRSTAVDDALRHMARLHVILSGMFIEHGSLADRLLGKKKDPWSYFRLAKTEIEQLVQALSDALPKIIDVKRLTEEVLALMQSTADEIAAHEIAGNFLIEYIGKEMPTAKAAAANALLARCMSLTRTLTQIAETDVLRRASIQNLLELIARVQDSVLVTLPSWIETCSMLSGPSATPTQTQTSDMGVKLQDILRSLKP